MIKSLVYSFVLLYFNFKNVWRGSGRWRDKTL